MCCAEWDLLAAFQLDDDVAVHGHEIGDDVIALNLAVEQPKKVFFDDNGFEFDVFGFAGQFFLICHKRNSLLNVAEVVLHASEIVLAQINESEGRWIDLLFLISLYLTMCEPKGRHATDLRSPGPPADA